jgi:hypothetical protein
MTHAAQKTKVLLRSHTEIAMIESERGCPS